MRTLLTIIMIFLALASPTFAYSKGSSASNMTYNIAAPITLADGTILKYTPVCQSECWLPMSISYFGTDELASKDLKSNDITYSKTLIKGNDDIKSVDYFYVSYEWGNVTTKTLDASCLKELGNGTIQKICNNFSYTNETRLGNYLKPLTSISMNKGTPKIIVLKGTVDSARESSVDIVPTILGTQMPELAVWNISSNVLSLPFNENTGTTTYDRSGLGNNLTLPSVVGWAEGRYDYGYDFNAYSNGTIAANTPMETGRTWTAWIKTTQSTVGIWFDIGDTGCGNEGIQIGLGITAAGKLNAHWGGQSWLGGPTSVNTGGWEFTAVTWNTTHFLFYMNDSATTIKLDAVNATANDSFTQHNIYVGSCGSANKYDGLLDEVQVWDTVLSQADLQNIMNNAIVDASSPTSTTLLLNGTAANYTGTYPTALNSTGVCNVTGLYVELSRNGTLIRNSTTPSINVTQWGAGAYNITAVCIGNSSYTSSSATYYATINTGSQSISLTGINNGTYPWGVNPLCTGNVTSNLYRNGSSASSENATNIQLTAGIWNWTCNTTINSNYTFNSISSIENISKGTPTKHIYFNGTEGNKSYSFGQYTNATATLTTLSDIYNVGALYRNGTNVSISFVPEIVKLPSGLWNYTYYYGGDANWSASSITFWANVSKTSSSCSLSLLPASPITYGTQTNATCTCTNTEISSNLYRNGTNVTSQNRTLVTLGVAAYAYVCNVSSTGNYTNASDSTTLIINKGVPALNLSFNSTNPVRFGEMVNVSCGLSGLTASLYNNSNLSVSNPYYFDTLLGLGDYYFFCNSSATANWTAANISDILHVTEWGLTNPPSLSSDLGIPSGATLAFLIIVLFGIGIAAAYKLKHKGNDDGVA